MINLEKKDFEQIVSQVIDTLPDKFKAKINNVAIFVKDEPSAEQLKKARLRDGSGLFGLFEGYAQARRLNFGPVLPDRITIFRRSILRYSSGLDEVKGRIVSTVKHEIAHHFGSDERGASQAGR